MGFLDLIRFVKSVSLKKVVPLMGVFKTLTFHRKPEGTSALRSRTTSRDFLSLTWDSPSELFFAFGIIEKVGSTYGGVQNFNISSQTRMDLSIAKQDYFPRSFERNMGFLDLIRFFKSVSLKKVVPLMKVFKTLTFRPKPEGTLALRSRTTSRDFLSLSWHS